MIFKYLLSFSLFVISSITFAGNINSGKYESIMLAITPDKTLQGYYSETMPDDVPKSCQFYFEGKIIDTSKIKIDTWSEEIFPGTAKIENNKITLSIPEARNHPGCMNLLAPDIVTGIDYELISSKKWIELVSITDDKAYLLPTPDSSKQKVYVVKGNIVGVLNYKDDWANIEYISDSNKSYKGWIKKSQYQNIANTKGAIK